MSSIVFDDDLDTATIDGETFVVDWFDADDLGFVNLVWLTDGRCFVRDDLWDCRMADDADVWKPATPMLRDAETDMAIRPATSREHQDSARAAGPDGGQGHIVVDGRKVYVA